MIIGRILSPVHSLGPGERVCLWTQGCSKKCPGCISPELQPFRGKEVEAKSLAFLLIKLAQVNNCTALTVSGGDPFEQADELLTLLEGVRGYFDDILVYTGYTLEEIKSGVAGESGIKCLAYIDVLIDSPYIKSLNTPDCVLRGSKNQTIHFLCKDKAERYDEYMQKGRILESFSHNNETIITGIFNEVDE